MDCFLDFKKNNFLPSKNHRRSDVIINADYSAKNQKQEVIYEKVLASCLSFYGFTTYANRLPHAGNQFRYSQPIL